MQPPGCLYINAHTHFLPQSFGHPDLQIVIPVSPECAKIIFGAVVERILAGARFRHGEVFDVSPTHLVRFCDSEESGRHILRLILLPPIGGHPAEGEVELFQGQEDALI